MSASDAGLPSPDLLRGHRRVAVDTNVLIALLEDQSSRGDVAALVFDAIDAGLAEGVAASLVFTEVLTGPARAGDAAMFERVGEALRDLPVRYVPISAEIATDAAWLRARRSMTFADALHLAAAGGAGATAFVTNDRRIQSTSQLEVLQLDDLAGAAGSRETGATPERGRP